MDNSYRKTEKTSVIFQRMRKKYLLTLLKLVLITGFLFCMSGIVDAPYDDWFVQAGAISIFIGVFVFTYITYNWYVCPECNAVPMLWTYQAGGGKFGASKGVDLNPYECAKCGAVLKEEI